MKYLSSSEQINCLSDDKLLKDNVCRLVYETKIYQIKCLCQINIPYSMCNKFNVKVINEIDNLR